jgi:hypothetical protein
VLRRRRGIVLPAVLAVLVALAMLSALMLLDAVQESRVSALAADAVRARAAAQRGAALAHAPPDLAALCVSGPLVEQSRTSAGADGSTATVRWRSVGDGLMRAEIVGRGRNGARHRLLAELWPDSAERVMGLYRCPDARALRPVPGGWLEGHPEG